MLERNEVDYFVKRPTKQDNILDSSLSLVEFKSREISFAKIFDCLKIFINKVETFTYSIYNTASNCEKFWFPSTRHDKY